MKKLKRKIRFYLHAAMGGLLGLSICWMAGGGFAADPVAAMAGMALAGLLLSALIPKKCCCCG